MLRSKVTLLGLLLIFVCSAASVSAEQAMGNDACDTDECVMQFKKMRKFAKNGSPDAQGVLSAMYINGYGTEKDVDRGIRWLKKAVKVGGSYYRNQLAMMYLQGENVDKDVERGLELLNTSLENENEQAAFVLGAMYAQGKFVSKDMQKAQKLLMDAALQGNEDAQYMLGVLYEMGEFGSKNIPQAIEFYKVAAAKNPDARKRLGELAPEAVTQFPDDPEIERITVRAPDLSEIVGDALDVIQAEGVWSGRGSTGTRISGRSCIVSGECKYTTGPAIARSLFYGNINATFARIFVPPG